MGAQALVPRRDVAVSKRFGPTIQSGAMRWVCARGGVDGEGHLEHD